MCACSKSKNKKWVCRLHWWQVCTYNLTLQCLSWIHLVDFDVNIRWSSSTSLKKTHPLKGSMFPKGSSSNLLRLWNQSHPFWPAILERICFESKRSWMSAIVNARQRNFKESIPVVESIVLGNCLSTQTNEFYDFIISITSILHI